MENKRVLVVEIVEGCEPEVGRMLWSLEDTRRWMLEELKDLPEDCVDKRGPVGVNTLGTVLYHVALIETSWLYDEALGVEVPEELARLFPLEHRDEGGVLSEMKGFELSSYVERLRIVREKLVEAYRGMSVEEFRQTKSYPQYDVSPEWVLHHLIQHEGEHLGQIQVIVESLREADRRAGA